MITYIITYFNVSGPYMNHNFIYIVHSAIHDKVQPTPSTYLSLLTNIGIKM